MATNITYGKIGFIGYVCVDNLYVNGVNNVLGTLPLKYRPLYPARTMIMADDYGFKPVPLSIEPNGWIVISTSWDNSYDYAISGAIAFILANI